jgi:DNA repair exonuclease SbcCD ATPase subunit
MKLQSIHLKNFRIHRDLKVDFNDRLTLISGPNESGKSTILHALSCALFLRAKGASEDHKSLRSDFHPGHPEVTLVFSTRNESLTLTKQFSGAGGTARLTSTAGGNWKDDQVDEKLQELLGVSPSKKPYQEWGHLLIRQRESGNDPLQMEQSQYETLFQRLEREGGAAIRITQNDQNVSNQIAELKSEWFTEGGKIAANSPLKKAQERLDDALNALVKAKDRLQELDEHETAYHQAVDAITAKEKELSQLEPQLETLVAQLADIKDLRAKERTTALEAKISEESFKKIQKDDQEIRNLRAEVQDSKDKVQPLRDELNKLDVQLTAALADLNAEGEKVADASKNESVFKRNLDCLDALLRKLELEKEIDQLEENQKKIDKLIHNIRFIPEFTDTEIRDIRNAEDRVQTEKGALDALSVKLKLSHGKGVVSVGGQVLAAGEERLLKDQAEITFGKEYSLIITPGGEVGREEAEKKLGKAAEALRKLLSEHKIKSSEEARSHQVELAKLREQLESIKKILSDTEDDPFLDRIDGLKQQLRNTLMELPRLQGEYSGTHPVEDISSIKRCIKECKPLIQEKTYAREKAEAERSAQEKRVSDLRSQRGIAKESVDAADREIDIRGSKIQVIEAIYLSDQDRSEKLQEAQRFFELKTIQLQGVRNEIQQHDPDNLELEYRMCSNAVDQARNALQDARVRKAASGVLLRQDGTVDPRAETLQAQAIHDRTEQEVQALQLRGDAIQRLHALFQEEKARLSSEYSAPLASKIRDYLETLFRRQVVVRLTPGDNGFEGIAISRESYGDVDFGFEKLSGGAAEQVATAVRLAIAELLAADTPGGLPVVFDDAFTYSDAERVGGIIRMLYKAAERGLQVIVMSCNPADYTGLGANNQPLNHPVGMGGNVRPTPIPPAALHRESHAQERGAVVASADLEVEPLGQSSVLPLIAPSPRAPVKTSDKAKFLITLGGMPDRTSTDQELRGQLGWDESIYDSVRETLIEAGKIISSSERGGYVSIVR